MEDGGSQSVGGQTPLACQQGPGVFDRLLLEIVAKGEVAEHLEKGVVTRGITDIVEIVVLAARTHTFLRRCSARSWRRLKAGKGVFERYHPGIDEHERRIIVRHERRARHLYVVGIAEVIEKRPANIVGRGHASAVRQCMGLRQATVWRVCDPMSPLDIDANGLSRSEPVQAQKNRRRLCPWGRAGTRRFSGLPGAAGQAAVRPLEDQIDQSASGPVIISSATSSVRPRIAASNRSQTSGFSFR